MIPNDIIEKIKNRSKIIDFLPDTEKAYGQNKSFCKCPNCAHIDIKKKTGLIIFENKNTAKCYKCAIYYSSAIDFIMKNKSVDYVESLKILANHYSIFIDEEKTEIKPTKAKKKISEKKKEETTFCDRQLFESGLNYDDIRIETTDETGTLRYVSPFLQGTRDQYGSIQEHKGDDFLIKYYDLEGKPVLYKPLKQAQLRPLIRVRWQNPALHIDKAGKPIKYQSPGGSGSHVYIPERIRKMYKNSRSINRLFIQEGEKKAEKSCKHGILSVGIMGIHNIANEQRLSDEIQMIVQKCDVKEVVFILDSDWNSISSELKSGQDVDFRPKTFFYAVKKYKEYLRTLANLGCPVEIYFGYLKSEREKGIDDILSGTLKDKEADLLTDIETAIFDVKGVGNYVNIHKITMLPDNKLADFWLLNDAEAFAEKNKEQLLPLKEFKIKNLLRRFDEKGKLELCQKLLPDEKFWEENQKTNRDGEITGVTISFHYVNCMNFLQNRGFYRYVMKSGEKVITYTENRIIKAIDHTDVKDYVKEFCREIKRIDVLNLLMKGGPQYLGPEKLSNLDISYPRIDRATPEKQCLFFQDKIWEISAEGIKEVNYGQYTGFVWSENIIKHKVNAIANFIEIEQLTANKKEKLPYEYQHIEIGEFLISKSKEAENCHFLKFLENTSVPCKKTRMKWLKLAKEYPDTKLPSEDTKEIISDTFKINRHIVNKLTCVGYLLHDWKNDNERKAVIAMDGKLSEVGASNGRTGKSVVGKALSKVINQIVIDGKNKKLEDDSFRYHEVTEKVKNLFFDDIRPNFEFESLFSVITGSMTVNQKSGLRFTLSDDETPKILLTTNHAVSGSGSSFSDRQSIMVFGDWYDDNWKPVNDFGLAFFSEWDSDQWNLFYNLMAYCLVAYFKAKQLSWSGSQKMGMVPAPVENVRLRQLRQIMGENFLTWAEMFFDWDSHRRLGNLNDKHVRVELYNKFKDECPQEIKYTLPTTFKKKMDAYCEYKGYHFNPTKHNQDGLTFNDYKELYPGKIFWGGMDKSGGKEYWTIANDEFDEI
jgi:DNA primase